MKKVLVLILVVPIFLVACSNQSNLQSWAFDVVTWNHTVYKVTSETVIEVEKIIGSIRKYSSNDQQVTESFF